MNNSQVLSAYDQGWADGRKSSEDEIIDLQEIINSQKEYIEQLIGIMESATNIIRIYADEQEFQRMKNKIISDIINK